MGLGVGGEDLEGGACSDNLYTSGPRLRRILYYSPPALSRERPQGVVFHVGRIRTKCRGFVSKFQIIGSFAIFGH